MERLTQKDLLFIAEHANNVYKDRHVKFPNLDFKYYEYGNINAYSFKVYDVGYFFIAGTDEPADWIDNANIILTRADNEGFFTRVHSGFYSAYKKIEYDLMILSSQCKEIVISGHSLGGAIATLGAFTLSRNKKKKDIFLVTFGSPRVGNYTFARKFNKRVKNSYRFVNDNDAVTRIPTVGVLFRHIDTLKQLGEKDFWTYFGSVDDHDMKNYVEKIKNQTIF